MQLRSILLSVFIGLLLFSSCEEKENVILMRPYIIIKTKTINSDYLGKTELIQIEASADWDVSNNSKCCAVEKIKKEKNEYLAVTILPNDTSAIEREVDLLITLEQITQKIHIKQTGKEQEVEEEKEIESEFYIFNVNGFYTTPIIENGKRIGYDIKSTTTFINPSISENIYMGAILNRKVSNPSQVVFYEQDGFKNITFGYYDKFKHLRYYKNVKPTKEMTDKLAEEVKHFDNPQNIEFFYSSTPLFYSSHKQLHKLGMCNLGLKLDELLYGSPYTQKEMQKKNGFIYQECRSSFRLIADYPKKIEGAFKENEDIQNLAYVNLITYGKILFLFVETDIEKEEAMELMKKRMSGQELSTIEKEQIDEIDFYTLYFDSNSNPHITMTEIDFNKLPIIPLSFTLNNFMNYGVDGLRFSVVWQ